MSTRKAQVIIEVDDKSLQELNQEIVQLESSIKNLKIGTEQWNKANQKLGDLKTKFQSATNEARKLQNVVQEISGAEQLRSVAKLGAGLVGTFTAVSGSIKMLGINSEAFDEMTAKATTLMSIMGGLNQISETFSAQNLKGLASIGKGFKGLVTTVKAASTGMKAALISTGIGALIVGVGLLIANFDKLKALVNRQAAKEKKAAEDAYKTAQAQTKLSQEAYNTEQKRIEIYKYRAELFGETLKLAQAENELAAAKVDYISAQLEEEKNLRDNLAAESVKAKKDRQEEIKDEIAISKQRTETLLKEQAMAGVLLNQTAQYARVAETVQEINDRIKDNADKQIILSAQADKQRAIYVNQLDTLQQQVELINNSKTLIVTINGEELKLTKEQEDQLDTLNAQIKALKIQEAERQRILKAELAQLEYDRLIQAELDKTAEKYTLIKDALNQEYDLLNANTKQYEDQVSVFESQQKQYEDLLKKKEALVNFDERGEGLLYQQNKELEDQLLSMNELFAQTAAMINIELEGKKYDEEKIDAAAKELAFFKQIADAQVLKLENDKQIALNRREDLEIQKEQLQVNGGALEMQKKHYEAELKTAKAKLQGAKSDEERKTALEKVVELEAKVQGLNDEILSTKTELTDVNGELLGIDNEILKINQDIDYTTQSILDKNKELVDVIEQQSRTYAKMQDFVGKYSEEIAASTQVVLQSLEMIAAFQDRKAAIAQERIDDYQKQLEELDEAEEERQSKLEDYEELLKDANGDRYDELLRLIDEEKNKKIAADTEAENVRAGIEAKIKDEENKKLAAEARAAKWRKAAALVDAVVQGALAVIKALPNVFLAVATGVAAAAGVATIAAQKTPPIPEGYASGGVVDKGGLIMVGEKGFELAEVPAKTRIYNHEDSVAMLASGRLPKAAFAEGGTYTPPAVSTGSSNLIDYDRLISGIANAMKAMPNPVVSVQKITTAQNEVKLTKKLAGL